MAWHRVASIEDCPPGTGCEVLVGDRVLALFNVEGEIYALDGICPHQGGPLGRGELHGCIVTCPWHGWQFDVRSGAHQLNRSLDQPRFPAKIEGDEVWVELDD